MDLLLQSLLTELQAATQNGWYPQNHICTSTDDETFFEMITLTPMNTSDATAASVNSSKWLGLEMENFLKKHGYGDVICEKTNYFYDYHMRETSEVDEETAVYDYPGHLHIVEGDTSFIIILTIKTI